MTMSAEWFIRRRSDQKEIIENSLRDLDETHGAPRKEIGKVLFFLYEIGFLEDKQ